MAEQQGRRRDGVDQLWEGEPGDYFPVMRSDGAVTALWFKLPTGTMGRIAATGHGNGEEPEWTIRVEPDGTVTVEPSIQQEEVPDHAPAWHGYLRKGVWQSA
jgi:hypothetical protein